jgi:3-phosphoshikimate 1-carboxyvinyltransferase
MLQTFTKLRSVKGELILPGDKSISHRSLIFSGMSEGRSVIRNLSGGDDVKSTIHCLREIGVNILQENNLTYVDGRGFKGFVKPEKEMYAGNSGTTARLLAGLLSSQKFESVITGDPSLSRRPMKRVIEPLRQMGADITSDTDSLPLYIRPSEELKDVEYKLLIPSAQIKSAVILAALHLEEESKVIEYLSSRDHTERMLGLRITTEERKRIIHISRDNYPQSNEYLVPSDISTALFFIIAALVLPDSEIRIRNISLNPTRAAVIDILRKMGGNITTENEVVFANEPAGDLIVSSSELKNINIPPEIIPNIIDEIPALAVAGLFAEGEFNITGAEELRHKESDRISAICQNLVKAGVPVEEYIDGFSFQRAELNRNLFFNSFGDHRIAMAFAVLSMLAEYGGIVEEFECVSVSNPDFLKQINEIALY